MVIKSRILGTFYPKEIAKTVLLCWLGIAAFIGCLVYAPAFLDKVIVALR